MGFFRCENLMLMQNFRRVTTGPPARRRSQRELLLSGLGAPPAQAAVGCYVLRTEPREKACLGLFG